MAATIKVEETVTPTEEITDKYVKEFGMSLEEARANIEAATSTSSASPNNQAYKTSITICNIEASKTIRALNKMRPERKMTEKKTLNSLSSTTVAQEKEIKTSHLKARMSKLESKKVKMLAMRKANPRKVSEKAIGEVISGIEECRKMLEAL